MSEKLAFLAGVVTGAIGVALLVPRILPLAKSSASESSSTASNSTSSQQELIGSTEALQKVEKQFRITSATLLALVRHFVVELDKGLGAPGHTIKALPSFVTRLPTGMETGSLLALDLGGTNLRVCEVELEGHGKFRMRQKKYTLTDQV